MGLFYIHITIIIKAMSQFGASISLLEVSFVIPIVQAPFTVVD
jgi:hypothetical protein